MSIDSRGSCQSLVAPGRYIPILGQPKTDVGCCTKYFHWLCRNPGIDIPCVCFFKCVLDSRGFEIRRLEASWNCSVLPGTSKAVTLEAEAPRSVSKNRALRGSC
jgi:hypothetical protein